MRRRLALSVVLCCLVCFGMLGLAFGAKWSPHLGLDLEGGLSVVFKPVHPVSTATLQNAANIMSQRANAEGVSQPNITTQGDQIVVDLPGVKDPAKLLGILGTTAQLLLRPVLCIAPPYVKAPKGTAAPTGPPPTCTGAYKITSANYPGSATANYNYPAVDPEFEPYSTTTPEQDTNSIADNIILPIPGSTDRYLLGPAELNGKQLTGTIIKSAYASLSQQDGWVVAFTLTSAGSPLFDQLATTYYQTPVADDLDGSVVSAPIIEAKTFGGQGQISGSFTQASANSLALELSYGALPVTLKQLTSEIISPTLGKSSLKAGILAGLLGLALVMLYTIFYYRALGIVVLLGLITTGSFIYGLVSVLSNSSYGLTLDLSGVTGLIVSVGITVDSYVVYFERLKDEVRAGRSIRTAVDRGFKSAFRTILSADAVSFIGAVVLWVLSVGDVRGFAFMLGISTAIDVVTAYVFTRPLVILLGRNSVFTEARHLGVARGLATVETST